MKPLTKAEFQSLCEHPFICLKKGQDIGNKMEQLFEHFDCRPQRTIRAEQTTTTFAMTMAGAGVSLVSQSRADDDQIADQIKFYIADEDLCRRKIYVAYPKNKYLSKASERFIDILEECVK